MNDQLLLGSIQINYDNKLSYHTTIIKKAKKA